MLNDKPMTEVQLVHARMLVASRSWSDGLVPMLDFVNAGTAAKININIEWEENDSKVCCSETLRPWSECMSQEGREGGGQGKHENGGKMTLTSECQQIEWEENDFNLGVFLGQLLSTTTNPLCSQVCYTASADIAAGHELSYDYGQTDRDPWDFFVVYGFFLDPATHPVGKDRRSLCDDPEFRELWENKTERAHAVLLGRDRGDQYVHAPSRTVRLVGYV